MTNEMNLAQLPVDAFRRMDEANDARFYDFPRLVTHIDEGAIAAVTNLYREYFLPNSSVLDLMSSWVSHLPEDVEYSRVVGVGMNAEELNANSRLTESAVQNLNVNQKLPFADAEFDAAAICVSVQYLTKPVEVFRELGRVLKPNAPLVVTFSNRCFPTKAVFAWQVLDDEGHIALVRSYFAESGAFQKEIEIRRHLPRFSDPLYAVIGKSL